MEIFIGASKHFKVGFRKFCAWVEHRNIRRDWRFNQSSQNRLRFEIKPMRFVPVAKVANFGDFMFFRVSMIRELPLRGKGD